MIYFGKMTFQSYLLAGIEQAHKKDAIKAQKEEIGSLNTKVAYL
jgi:hypothetical protein